MKVRSLDHFLHGALHVEFRGPELDRFIPALQAAGIRLHRVRMRRGRCTCTFSLRDFDVVYRLCRQHKVKIRFLQRIGLPFLHQRGMRRKSFIVGFVLFLAIIFLMSSMVWRVDIQATSDEDIASIAQAAREAGLYVGAWKWRIPDVLVLQQRILGKSPNLVWIGVRIDGSIAEIQAIEKIESVKPIAETPHNIIAAKPGVIRKVFAARGIVTVKPGQYVQPGQILISGDLYAGKALVPATGVALAEVWYTSRVSVPLQVSQAGLTGAYVTRDYLDIGSLGVRIWGWKQPNYSASTERINTTDLHVGNWVLPLQLRTVTEYEATQSAAQVSLDVARETALMLAADDVRASVAKDGTILGQTVLQQEVSHGTLYETVLTRTEEDIGIPAPMPGLQQENQLALN